MSTYDEIKAVNGEMTLTEIKGKNYAEVNQRIKAFRKLNPNGNISTNIVDFANGVVIIKATISDEEGRVIGSGIASEKENSSMINKTSFIENCETSAVGRALGMCGYGIDCAVASKEEMETKEEVAMKLEKELEKLSIDYTKLRSVLTELECDFRNEKTNSWILEKAKVETQDLEELDNEQLKRLIRCYRGMISKKNEQLLKEKNEMAVIESGGF